MQCGLGCFEPCNHQRRRTWDSLNRSIPTDKGATPYRRHNRHGEIGAWLTQRQLPKQKNRTSKIKLVSAQFRAMDCTKSGLIDVLETVSTDNVSAPARTACQNNAMVLTRKGGAINSY